MRKPAIPMSQSEWTERTTYAGEPSVSEYAKDRMKAYMDTLPAVSYSGADIKAIVFLPIDHQQLTDERAEAIGRQNQLKQEWNSLDQLEGDRRRNNATGTELSRIATAKSKVSRELEATQDSISLIDEKRKKGEKSLKAFELGNLQTITYSIHREKFPVRTLGRVYPKSYVRGSRTIAGSMIFTVIDQHILWELLNANTRFYNTGVKGSDSHYPEFTTSLVDQLPPFDVTLLFANEIGDVSYMVLYGVEIVNEGQTMSIQDLLTENVVQYVARDIDPLRRLYDERVTLHPDAATPTASDIALQSKRRQTDRFDPFR